MDTAPLDRTFRFPANNDELRKALDLPENASMLNSYPTPTYPVEIDGTHTTADQFSLAVVRYAISRGMPPVELPNPLDRTLLELLNYNDQWWTATHSGMHLSDAALTHNLDEALEEAVTNTLDWLNGYGYSDISAETTPTEPRLPLPYRDDYQWEIREQELLIEPRDDRPVALRTP